MERKIDRKMEGKINWRKIKSKFKLNKLILYVHSNLFYLSFFFVVQGLKNLKICTILIIFDFFIVFFIVNPNMRN